VGVLGRRQLDPGVVALSARLDADTAAEAYRDLVFRQWWTRWQGRADAQGRCEVRAFYGKHQVKAGNQMTVVELKRAQGKATLALK